MSNGSNPIYTLADDWALWIQFEMFLKKMILKVAFGCV